MNHHAQPLTIAERLLKAQSLIFTVSMACQHKNDEDSDFSSISDVAELAADMIGECAEEIEEKTSKKEKEV